MKAQPDLLLAALEWRLVRDRQPVALQEPQETMSEVIVGVIANLIVWTFILTLYVLKGVSP